MSRNLIATLGLVLLIPASAFAATQAAAPVGDMHAAHLKSLDPIGDEETNALNVLAANGYTGMTNLRVHGDQVFVDAKKNDEVHHLVVTAEDMITPAPMTS